MDLPGFRTGRLLSGTEETKCQWKGREAWPPAEGRAGSKPGCAPDQLIRTQKQPLQRNCLVQNPTTTSLQEAMTRGDTRDKTPPTLNPGCSSRKKKACTRLSDYSQSNHVVIQKQTYMSRCNGFIRFVRIASAWCGSHKTVRNGDGKRCSSAQRHAASAGRQSHAE